jgi:hypothetical protein
MSITTTYVLDPELPSQRLKLNDGPDFVIMVEYDETEKPFITRIHRENPNDSVAISWHSNELAHRGSGLTAPINFESGQAQYVLLANKFPVLISHVGGQSMWVLGRW